MHPEDVARILDDLGQRLGPAGEYVFGLAVRQAFIDGILGTLVGVGLFVGVLVIAVIGARHIRIEWARKCAQADSYSSADPVLGVGFPAAIGGLVLALPGGFAVVQLLVALPKLLNPEYAALMDILSRIVP